MACQSSYILRRGYTRKAYTRADGTRVKAVKVAAVCVPDKGAKGKTPASKKVLPKPRKGSLGQYGYHNVQKLTMAKRRAALTKAVKAENYSVIVKRVNLIANYNKNSNPAFHKILRADIKWMQNNLGSSKTSKKSSRKSSTRARKISKKSSRKTSKKSSTRARKLYTSPNGAVYYRYKKTDGTFGKRYVK